MKHLIQHLPLGNCVSPPFNQVRRVDRPTRPLPNDVLAELVDACRCNCEEVCGLISSDGGVLYIPNSHVEPRYNFYMDIDDLRAALYEIKQVQEKRVIGVFHTHHTNIPWPSPVDLGGWPNHDLGWRYWIATNHEVIEWSYHR